MKGDDMGDFIVRPGRINSHSHLNPTGRELGPGRRGICVVCGKVIPRRTGMRCREELCAACGERLKRK
jgi:hypothetical protein